MLEDERFKRINWQGFNEVGRKLKESVSNVKNNSGKYNDKVDNE